MNNTRQNVRMSP